MMRDHERRIAALEAEVRALRDFRDMTQAGHHPGGVHVFGPGDDGTIVLKFLPAGSDPDQTAIALTVDATNDNPLTVNAGALHVLPIVFQVLQPVSASAPLVVGNSTSWVSVGPEVAAPPLAGYSLVGIFLNWAGNPVGGAVQVKVKIEDTRNTATVWSLDKPAGTFSETWDWLTSETVTLPGAESRLALQISMSAADAGSVAFYSQPFMLLRR